jgi:hypothetical protein
MNAFGDWLACAYVRMKNNDLPNWLAILFTVIVWPLALFWWNTP